MKIGDLASATGISVATIRIYEKEGLIGGANRTSGRFRLFTSEHETRLRFIKHLRDLGFALDDIREVLAIQPDSNALEEAPLLKMQTEAEMKADALKKLIDRLASVRSGAASLASVESVFEN